MTAADTTLLNRVIAASRLSATIAPFAVSRLLLRADVAPEDLTRESLGRALPQLEEGLAVYLRGDELGAAVADLRTLAAGSA